MSSFSIVIPTVNRHQNVLNLIGDIMAQTVLPNKVIIADASEVAMINPKEELRGIPCEVIHCLSRSAAVQRNEGALRAQGKLAVFIDDDIRLAADSVERLLEPFFMENTGAVAGRMINNSHSSPSGLLQKYYRWQAGYEDAHYGARLLGPAITTFPCYEEQGSDEQPLIQSEWLNSAFLACRSDVFENVGGFPSFAGYSPFEDVYLTALIAQSHALYFHSQALYEHPSETAPGGEQDYITGKAFMQNMRKTAREALGQPAFESELKLSAHKLFICLHLLRSRPEGWAERSLGTLLG